MNKTININLGGFFFHIDEVAYQKLKRYLESISKSLSDDPQGKNEIIADIEARISELLSEKITDSRQVVNEGDIDNIISIMGQPEDYADTEEVYNDSSYSYNRNSSTGKKLFRDGDDKFLGGVAAGIAHYFNIDAIWIRLGLLALFFGAGFGIILYIILWILLPEAKTTAEKLQMEGEPVNIDNIEKKIREEFNNVSENVTAFASKASERLKDGANEISEKMNQTFSGKTKKNNGLQDFINTIAKIMLVFFKVIGKLIGAILVFIAAAVILWLIISGFSFGSIGFLNVDGEFSRVIELLHGSTIPFWLIITNAIVLIGIPFLILFVLGLRILSSSIKQISKPTSLTLLGIWFVALLTMIFTLIEFGSSHANYGDFTKKTNISIIENDTISLKLINNDEIHYKENLRTSSHKYEVDIDGESKVYSNNVKIDVKRSISDEAYLVLQKESRGKSSTSANKNAEKIEYNFEISENTIVLNAYYLSDLKNIWKDEEVNITLYFPKGITVYFDNSIKNFLDNVENETDIYDKDMANHHFIMTNKTLKCTDCGDELKGNETAEKQSL